MVRAAYTLRKDDDDFGQPNALINKVMDDEARARLVSNVVGHLRDGVTKPILERAVQYWRQIDQAVGDRVVEGIRDKL
jgi:catalase